MDTLQGVLISAQHKKLRSQLSIIHSAIRANADIDTLRLYIDTLLILIDEHFKDEESIMVDANYFNSDGHQTAHKQFLDLTCAQYTTAISKKSREDIVTLVELVTQWINNHTSLEEVWLDKVISLP